MPPHPTLTPNRVVAMRLREARDARGWTQAEAAEKIAPFLPPRAGAKALRWTKHDQAVAEAAGRTRARPYGFVRAERRFTANELVAFSLAFGKPLLWFLQLPPDLDPQLADGAVEYQESIDSVVSAGRRPKAFAREWRREVFPKVVRAIDALESLAEKIEPEKGK